MMLKGLETIDLRVRAQSQSALAIAQAVRSHENLVSVAYPGLEDHPQYSLMPDGGTVLALDLGDQTSAFKFLNALSIAIISNNLGDTKSIATHPATTTHQRLSEDQRDALRNSIPHN